MAKRFIVRCYYEYVARVEVEADSYEEEKLIQSLNELRIKNGQTSD